MTREIKQKILAEIGRRRELFEGSDGKFAVSCGISASQYSRIKNGETEKVLSDANWIGLARRFNVGLTDAPAWITVRTAVYEQVTTQLETCQKNGLSTLLCDIADIGKTYSAREYVRTHRSAIYVDCSQVKTKRKMIRYIAKQFGVGSLGKFEDVYDDLIYYIRSLDAPLIILDEAGDLEYEAFLEIKALWNATEGSCGWYMMGADGLREKIRRSISFQRVGYTEIFSRFGKKYGKVVPAGAEESRQFLQTSATMIIKANATEGTNVNEILKRTLGEDNVPSLRRIYKELVKNR